MIAALNCFPIYNDWSWKMKKPSSAFERRLLLRALFLLFLWSIFTFISICFLNFNINLDFPPSKNNNWRFLTNSERQNEGEGEGEGGIPSLYKSSTHPRRKKITLTNRCNAKYKTTLNGSGKININFHFS